MQPNPPQPPPPPLGARPPVGRPLPRRLSPWWVVGGTLVGGALIFGGLLAYSTYARAAEPRPGAPPKRQLPPLPPPPTNGPVVGAPVPGAPVQPGQPGSWTPVGGGTAPPGWDFEGNQLYISPNCDVVLEGELFETDSKGHFSISAVEAPTLVDTLAIEDNSVYGFIDYLLADDGYDTPEAIAEEIMVQANALCADIPPDQRPPALAAWYDDFVERIRPWVEDVVIPFEPDVA